MLKIPKASAGQPSTTQIVVEIMPDPYGTEVSWEIRNENDIVVASATCTDPVAITWQAMSIVQNWVVQVLSLGCYTFTLKDSCGDGLTPGIPGGTSPTGNPDEVFYPRQCLQLRWNIQRGNDLASGTRSRRQLLR